MLVENAWSISGLADSVRPLAMNPLTNIDLTCFENKISARPNVRLLFHLGRSIFRCL